MSTYRGYLITATSGAYCLSPVDKHMAPDTKGVWIPRSWMATQPRLTSSPAWHWARMDFEIRPAVLRMFVAKFVKANINLPEELE